jgi:hypothetical protein
MSKMSDSYRLVCRNGTWYYRRRVPDHLVTALSKAVVQVSLNTRSKAEAKKRRTIQDIEWDARFAAMEQDDLKPTITLQKGSVPLEDLVRDYVRKMDKKAETRLHEHAPQNVEERAAAQENIQYELGILSNPADPRREEWISQVWDRILKEASVQFEPVGLAREQFHALVRRALIELSRTFSQDAGDDAFQSHQALWKTDDRAGDRASRQGQEASAFSNNPGAIPHHISGHARSGCPQALDQS